ncbi:MAG: energy transducer TonB [Alphaproteobacteria bacterium]
MAHDKMQGSLFGHASVAPGNPIPRYPFSARQRGQEGKVIFEVEVRPDGTVENVQVVASSGYRLLDDSARDALRRWRFVPGIRNGIPVASTVRVPIHFRLTD